MGAICTSGYNGFTGGGQIVVQSSVIAKINQVS